MSHYPEPGSDIKDKVKVVLDFSNYHATGVDTSDLAVEKEFIALKGEVKNQTLISWLMFQLL